MFKENDPVNVTLLRGNAIAKKGSRDYLTSVNGRLMRKVEAFIKMNYYFLRIANPREANQQLVEDMTLRPASRSNWVFLPRA